MEEFFKIKPINKYKKYKMGVQSYETSTLRLNILETKKA